MRCGFKKNEDLKQECNEKPNIPFDQVQDLKFREQSGFPPKSFDHYANFLPVFLMLISDCNLYIMIRKTPPTVYVNEEV